MGEVDRKHVEMSKTMSKLYITYLLIKSIGFIKALLIVFVVLKVYTFLIRIIFGLTEMTPTDLGFYGETNADKLNNLSIIRFENFNAEKLKTLIIEKAIKKIPKLQSKVIFKFWNYYWKVSDIKEAIGRVKIIPEVLKSEKDMLKFADSFSNKFFEAEKELPWEIAIVKYGENNGALIWKYDHILSDGLGMVSLMCGLASNYDEKIFPSIMRSSHQPSKLKELFIDFISYFAFFYYFPLMVYKNFGNKTEHSHLKSKGEPTGESKTAFATKEYELSLFEPIRKKYGVSFNEIMMTAISHSLSIYFKEKYNCDSCSKLWYFQPVGRKPLPHKMEEVQISNDAVGIGFLIPIIRDVKTEIKKISTIMRPILSNIFLVPIFQISSRIFSEILPLSWYRNEVSKGMSDLDMTVTNVPGATEPLFYDEMKAIGTNAIITTGRFDAFIPIISYNKKFGFSFSGAKNSDVDPEKVIEIIHRVIDNKILTLVD